MTTHQIFIAGDRPWTRTPLALVRGGWARIRYLRGTVRFNTLRVSGVEVGPAGHYRPTYLSFWPSDAALVDPLMGRDDGHAGLLAMLDGRVEFVGGGAVLRSQQGGELSLGINDGSTTAPAHLANTGGFWVEVGPAAGPDPDVSPLYGYWKKVGESPPSPVPDDLTLYIAKGSQYRVFTPDYKSELEDGILRESGRHQGRDYIKLFSRTRGVEVLWFYKLTPDGKGLTLERQTDGFVQTFQRSL